MTRLHIAGTLAALGLLLFERTSSAKTEKRIKRGSGADCQRGFCLEFDTATGLATCSHESDCNQAGCLVAPNLLCTIAGFITNPFGLDDGGTDRPAGADLLDPSAFLE